MVHYFHRSHIDLIKSLFSGSQIDYPVLRSSFRGEVKGLVKFQLVWSHGIALIERTYIPWSPCKSASKRYVSLDSFIKECDFYYTYSDCVDDLPFK